MNLIKILSTTLTVIVFHSLVFAQETPFGKKLAEDFWKMLEQGSFVGAENKLSSLKRREPNFDASKMDQALADAKAKKSASVTAAKDAVRSKASAGANLREIFFTRVVQADSSDTAETIKNEIEKYAKKTDEVLAVDRTTITGDLESALASIKRELATDSGKNAKLIKFTNDALQPTHAEVSYYELLLRQSFWDNARKIFPDETEISKAYNSITASINALGTSEQRATQANKNMNAKIDAERLPKAAIKDANLERIFQTAFNNEMQAKSLNHTFLKAVITTNDYGLVRHQITGIILGRSRVGAIAFKDKDGKCKHTYYRIYQDYIGGSFSGSWRGSTDSFSAELRCQNVN